LGLVGRLRKGTNEPCAGYGTAAGDGVVTYSWGNI